MADSVCWVFVEERTGFGAAVLADAAPYQTTSCFSRIRCPARDKAQLPGAATRSQNFAARFRRALGAPSTRSHRSARLLQCRGPNSSHWTVARSLDRWRRKPGLPGLSPTEHRCLRSSIQHPRAQNGRSAWCSKSSPSLPKEISSAGKTYAPPDSQMPFLAYQVPALR